MRRSITDVEAERLRIIGMLSLEDGESDLFDLKVLPLSFLMDLGDILSKFGKYKHNLQCQKIYHMNTLNTKTNYWV